MPLALVLWVILEVAVLIAVGRWIGFWPTLLLVIVLSALGAWLLRREGRKTWQSLRTALRSGQMPSREIADAVLVFVGGVLLTLPGFVSGIVGLVFVLPFTRPVARIGLETLVARRLLAAGMSVAPGEARVRRTRDRDEGDGDVVEGEIVDE
ncbi:FxsA family protein [Janibacter limosus]|uniref:FxsA family protein n=1 Tax=Janibacter limosus TaxID=53458 RepID=UPI001FDF1B46|nr:FxsA family protein [Janibacter limosus]